MRRALVVALALLAGCGGPPAQSSSLRTDGPRPSPSSSSSSSASCPTLVLGFRGQGQSTHGFHGAGREAGQVAERLGDRVVGVRFRAGTGGASYAADVADGVRKARRWIRSSCGRVVLVGYSLGAEVAHRVAVAHPDRVGLVVLMGDPLRDPADRVRTVSLGTGPLAGRGNGGPYAQFPAAARARVLEVCVRGDDVCNAPVTGRVGPPSGPHHVAYQGAGAVLRIVGAAS